MRTRVCVCGLKNSHHAQESYVAIDRDALSVWQSLHPPSRRPERERERPGALSRDTRFTGARSGSGGHVRTEWGGLGARARCVLSENSRSSSRMTIHTRSRARLTPAASRVGPSGVARDPDYFGRGDGEALGQEDLAALSIDVRELSVVDRRVETGPNARELVVVHAARRDEDHARRRRLQEQRRPASPNRRHTPLERERERERGARGHERERERRERPPNFSRWFLEARAQHGTRVLPT